MARGFVAFPEEREIWAPGKCLGGEIQQRGPDLDRLGNAARTFGAHQIPGIRR
jgi:hypothetical protein